MKIEVSEKKGKEITNEYYEFSIVRLLLNYFIYIFLSFMVVGFFLFFILSQGKLDSYNNLWAISILSIFFILWIKSSYGNFYYTYVVVTRKKWLSSILGELHGILYIIFVFSALFSRGDIILTSAPFIANIFFAISLSLTFYIVIKQNLVKDKK